MNIFYLDHDVKKCAEMHNDKHVVKMILEYAQLLSTAHRILDGIVEPGLSKTGRKKTVYRLPDERDSVLYGATHVHHPSAIWVRQSKQNYVWLMQMWCCLLQEYTYRYGKQHACSKLVSPLSEIPHNLPDKPFTEPTPAMPDDVKILKEIHTDRYTIDSLLSYRNYYIKNKTHLASWKNRPVPSWYLENIRPT